MTGVRLVSAFSGVMAIIVGAAYLGPTGWVRRPPAPNQTSLVQTIEAAGPVWPVLFGVTGVLLLVSAYRSRWLIGSHVAAVFAWTFYGVALLIGAILSQPPAPYITAVIVIGVAWFHFGMIFAHRDAGSLDG